MKVYISQIGEWEDVFEMRVWKNESDAYKYICDREEEIRLSNPKRFEHSLWSEVEGPFEVQ